MEPVNNSKPFDLFVTHVRKEHGLVKILGQTDIQTGQVVEKYLGAVADQLEGGAAPFIDGIEVGQIVIASRDGSWFRAKVVSLEGTNKLTLYFLDYGNTCSVALANVRTGVHSQLNQIQALAQSFILAEVVPPGGDWSKPALEFVADALVNDHCRAVVTHRARGHTFARLFRRDCREPLINDMVQCGMAIQGFPNIESIPPTHNFVQPPIISVPQPSPTPTLFPAPVSPNYPPPLSIRVPPLPPPHMTAPPPHQFLSAPPAQRSALFRPMHLETGTWYTVYLSSTEGGAADFCIQLESLSKRLADVMEAVNASDLRPLPMQAIQAGVPCLARYTLDNTIYRAVVLKRDTMAKVYYLDFGNSESLPFDQVFTLPAVHLNTQMLSVRCSVYQWPDLDGQDRLRAKQRFDSYNDRPLNCRVVSTEAGTFASARTVVQLFEDGTDIGQEIRLWVARQHNQGSRPLDRQGHQSLTFDTLHLAGVSDVYLSYHGTGPSQFYVSRADQATALSSLMRDICKLQEAGSLFPLSSAPMLGIPCLAQYSDGVWYRATVTSRPSPQATVKVYFVDYGNTEVVSSSNLCAIPPGLVTLLPAQAVSVRLSGFGANNVSSEKLKDTFIRLVGKEKFRVKVEGVETNGVCLVQATTLPPPGTSINSELLGLAKGGSRSPTPHETEELKITWWEDCNNFYGQHAHRGNELKDFLDRLSEYCYSQASQVYQGAQGHSHKGRVVAVPDTSSLSPRFLRARVIRDNLRGDKVELALLDVGGRNRMDQSLVLSMPPVLARHPEFGLLCTLGVRGGQRGCGDSNLRSTVLNNLIEVKRVRKTGDHMLVTLNPTSSKKVSNQTIIEYCRHDGERNFVENNKLNELFERQNNKQNNRLNDNNVRPGENGHSEHKPRNFDRGDLRNSLREKRAAKELVMKNKNMATSLRCRQLKIGFKGKCKITWMYNPNHFYIQAGDLSKFEILMGNLQAASSEVKEEQSQQWSKDIPVAARWTDGCWYRGEVISSQRMGSKVDIFFVDFGNTGTVDQEDIVGLAHEFGQLDCQAIKVGLAGIEPVGPEDWNQDKLSNYFQQESYQMEVVRDKHKDDGLLVHLCGGEVARALVRDGLAQAKGNILDQKQDKKGAQKKPKETSSDSDSRSEVSFGKGGGKSDHQSMQVKKSGKVFTAGDFPSIPSKKIVGRVLTGNISHINSWQEFWFQPELTVVENITAQLNSKDQQLGKPVLSIEEGECCIALWDNIWYRAVVLEKADPVSVNLVDCGNSLSIPLSEIRAGEFCLYDTPPAAIKCRLDNKLDDFEKIVEDIEYKPTLRVKSFYNNQFIVKLEDKKKGKKSRDKKGSDRRQDVTVVHVEKVDKVWVVPIEKFPGLEKLMQDLAEWMENDENHVVLKDVKVGELCCVPFSQDGEMYRAKVVWLEDKTAEVVFYDYGNSEEVDLQDILELPSQFREEEPAGLEVCVKDAGLALDTEEMRQKLETALAKNSVSIQLEGGEGIFFVEGKKLSLEKILRSKGDSLNLFQIAGSPRVECCIGFAEQKENGGNCLWLVSQEQQHKLDTMMARLQGEAKQFGKASKICPGDLVCARFSQDYNFYRARVMGPVTDLKVKVHYLDFGNTELVEVSDLKMLPMEFRLHPGFAMEVTVDGVGDCQMLGPVEVQQMVTEAVLVTAEIVQPRGGVVRLYAGSERVAMQDLASVTGLRLPPTRLRPGEDWLARLTSASSKGLALQNISAAAAATLSLSGLDKEDWAPVRPQVGELFIQEMEGVARRMVAQGVTNGLVSACSIDSQQMLSLSLTGSKLFTSPPGKHTRMSPAALTAAPLTTRTRDKYQVQDRLFRVTVSNNSLRLVETSWSSSVVFSSQSSSFSPESLPITGDVFSLTLSLPTHKSWTASLLSAVRNKVVQAGLKVCFGTDLIVLPEEEKLNLDQFIDSFGTTHNSDVPGTKRQMPVFLLDCLTDDPVSVAPGQVCEEKDGEFLVKQHPLLPEVKIPCGQNFFNVVKKGKNMVVVSTKEQQEVRDEVKAAASANKLSENIEENFSTGDLCLYFDGKENHRAIVADSSLESLEIHLLDSGLSVICVHEELSAFPPDMLPLPPTVLSVTQESQLGPPLIAGSVVRAEPKISEGGVLLKVIGFETGTTT